VHWEGSACAPLTTRQPQIVILSRSSPRACGAVAIWFIYWTALTVHRSATVTSDTRSHIIKCRIPAPLNISVKTAEISAIGVS
jgi:hypothetical protein